MPELTAAQFRDDVKRHRLDVFHDVGMYRHIKLSDGTFNRSFTIVTAPGTLTYTGDMGTYVFERIVDMFEYFRTYDPKNDESVDQVAPETWAGKCVAIDKACGVKHFNTEAFKAHAKTRVDEFVRDHGLEYGDAESLWDDVQSALDNADAETWGVWVGALEGVHWWHDGSKRQRVFSDDIYHEMPGCEELTHHFQWACRAIRWAIATYDIAKAATDRRRLSTIGVETVGDLMGRLSLHPNTAPIMALDGENGGGAPRSINFGPIKHTVNEDDARRTSDCEDRVGKTVVVFGFGCY